jgi:hypothetical protein
MIRQADDQPLKGGLGGGAPGPLIPEPATPSRTEASELKLIGQAVRQRWNVPELALDRLPAVMAQMAADSRREDRARIAAAKVLVAMVGQNNSTGSGGGTNVNVGVVVNQPGADLLD